MTNEVIWTKIVLERFIEQANLSEDEEIVMRTRAAGWSRTKQAMELNGQGYYDVAVTATVVGTAVGNVTMAVYQDGAPVPGMNASQTVKAIGDTVTLGTSGIVRVYCGKNSSTLTVVIGGQAVTGSNLAIDITKQ